MQTVMLAGRLTHIIYGAVDQKLGLCVILLQNPEGDTSQIM